jgi:phage tail-like protein
MAEAKQVLTGARYYLSIDQLEDVGVKKVSGLSITLETAGDTTAYATTKDGLTTIQATVASVTSGTITVEFVAAVDQKKMHDWFKVSHPVGGSFAGGGSEKGGERRTASLFALNQANKPAAQWDFTGVFPKSYKTSKMEPGGTELFTETVEFVYETCHRIK